jgi:teichuronic acid biosynthesis glycosyltransferase TuaC
MARRCAPARNATRRGGYIPASLRVLVVTSLYPTAEHPERGRFVADQVDALRALGAEIELFTFEPGGANYLKAARELRRRHRHGAFDVVHAHHGLGGWTARVLGSGPLVVTFHGTDLEHRVVGPLSRRLARVAALPATVSAALAQARLPEAGSSLRVAVLPCGIDPDRFVAIGRAEARRELGLDPAGRYLLFPSDPGRPEKRYERATELAAAVGAELLSYHQTPPDRVPLYVNAAAAVVVTSEREGFGLAALEALACEVPVLSTDVGIAPLALAGIEGTLCAPFSVETWKPLVARHLDDPDPRVSGRERALLFGRDHMAARVLKAYGDVAAPNGPVSTRFRPGSRR